MGQQPQENRSAIGNRLEPERRDRLIQEHEHDPYKSALKPADPSVCSRCRAVYEEGRWRWGARPANATETVCQACRRIEEGIPASILTMSGAFVQAHRAEIMAQVRHQETLENADHPLNRIMDIHDTADGISVTTTDLHLPRRIAEALDRHHQGALTWKYAEGECFLRVNWHAD